MKKRLLALLLVLCLAASLTGTVWAAAEQEEPPTAQVSDNCGTQNYSNWARPMQSYLYEDGDGNLVRVELIKDKLVAETYSADFELLSARTLPMELKLFGGFFAGEKYNFLVFGDVNPYEESKTEVCRVVKYSKDWERLGETSFKGMNTTAMFEKGSCRMAEGNGYLYVRTCHEMYARSGESHQANVTFNIDEETMELGAVMEQMANPALGYVAYSFNQLILIDDSNVIAALDHGIGVPRDLVVLEYNLLAGDPDFTMYGVKGASFCHFAGETRDEYTGGSVGGFAASDTHYLAAYNLDSQSGQQETVRNVQVGAVARNSMAYLRQSDNIEESGVPCTGTSISLTDYPKDGTVTTTTPQMVQLDKDRFLVLWQVLDLSQADGENTLSYAYVDGTGQLIGEVRTVEGALSDCQPIVVDGEAVWYVTENSMPVFYILGDRGLRSVKVIPEKPQFADVPRSHWSYPYVQAAYRHNVVIGSGTNEAGEPIFNPNGTVTMAEFCVMLANAVYPEEVAGKTRENWYNCQVEVLEDHDIFRGIDMPPLTAIATRNDMALMVFNLLMALGEGIPDQAELNAAAAEIPDLDSVPALYKTPVLTCYALGIIDGKPGIGFDGTGDITRGSLAALYTKMAKAVDGI